MKNLVTTVATVIILITQTSTTDLRAQTAAEPGSKISLEAPAKTITLEEYGQGHKHPLAGQLPEHVIFRTAQRVSTALGGLEAMDARCRTKAHAAGLGGTWLAILSDSKKDAKERIAAAGVGGPFFNTHQPPQQVAAGLDHLFGAKLTATLYYNEFGTAEASDSATWTATLANGTYAGASYEDWTSFSGGAKVGRQLSTDSQWLNWFDQSGTKSASLYCLRTALDQDFAPAQPSGFFHTIFVSSATFDGDLGGLDGADASCHELADAAGRGDTTWRAILSDSATDARERLDVIDPVFNTNGELVANDFADLFDGGNAAFVRFDEYGALRNDKLVWTGSLPDGTRYSPAGANAYKVDWTSPSGSVMAGYTTEMGAKWLHRSKESGRFFPARLYCIDQCPVGDDGEICSGNGTCARDEDGNLVCACDLRYTGETCDELLPVPEAYEDDDYRIFVTAETYGPDFASIEDADTICRSAAEAAHLGGGHVWRALLSSSTRSAEKRLEIPGGLVDVRGRRITAPSALFKAPNNGEIDRDQFGKRVSFPGNVWTGSADDGSFSGSSCEDWTSVSDGLAADVGRVGRRDASWTEAGELGCDETARLYCVETPEIEACDTCDTGTSFDDTEDGEPAEGETVQYVFVTRDPVMGHFVGGERAADLRCQAAAARVGLDDLEWRALLTNTGRGTGLPIGPGKLYNLKNFRPGAGRKTLGDGEIVYHDATTSFWERLKYGLPVATERMAFNEYGGFMGDDQAPVWTGFKDDGSPGSFTGANCWSEGGIPQVPGQEPTAILGYAGRGQKDGWAHDTNSQGDLVDVVCCDLGPDEGPCKSHPSTDLTGSGATAHLYCVSVAGKPAQPRRPYGFRFQEPGTVGDCGPEPDSPCELLFETVFTNPKIDRATVFHNKADDCFYDARTKERLPYRRRPENPEDCESGEGTCCKMNNIVIRAEGSDTSIDDALAGLLDETDSDDLRPHTVRLALSDLEPREDGMAFFSSLRAAATRSHTNLGVVYYEKNFCPEDDEDEDEDDCPEEDEVPGQCALMRKIPMTGENVGAWGCNGCSHEDDKWMHAKFGTIAPAAAPFVPKIVWETSHAYTFSSTKKFQDLLISRHEQLFNDYLGYWSHLQHAASSGEANNKYGNRPFYPKRIGDDLALWVSPAQDRDYVAEDVLGGIICAKESEYANDPGLLRIAQARFYDRSDILEKLVELANDGCEIQVVVRPDYDHKKDSVDVDGFRDLVSAAASLGPEAKGKIEIIDFPGVAMHHKLMLYEGHYNVALAEQPRRGEHQRMVWTGSQNWSGGALRHHDETWLQIVDDEVYFQYLIEWERVAYAASVLCSMVTETARCEMDLPAIRTRWDLP